MAAYFVAHLYGLPIPPSRVIPIVLTSVVTSFAVGGVPSGAAVMLAPVLLAAGLPVEAMGLLLAVDPLPNAFRTVANVTGMLAVTALSAPKGRGQKAESRSARDENTLLPSAFCPLPSATSEDRSLL